MPRFPHCPVRLVDNWREILRYAWSVWLLALAALLSFAEVALTLAGWALPFPPIVTALLTAFVTAAALVARVLLQKRFSGDRK